jgi:hypothetical protein
VAREMDEMEWKTMDEGMWSAHGPVDAVYTRFGGPTPVVAVLPSIFTAVIYRISYTINTDSYVYISTYSY